MADDGERRTGVALKAMSVGGLTLIVLATLLVIISAFRRIELSEPAISLILIGLGGVVLGELLPKIQSIKVGPSGVDIGMKDLSQSLNDQIVGLTGRLGELEVEQSIKASEKGGNDLAKRAGWEDPPPELGEPGPAEDDPRAGMFGGSPSQNGILLSAKFLRHTKSWAEVRLTVAAEKPGDLLVDVSAVEFFLHDTFDPDRIKSPIVDGRAQLTLTIWGGFTVGVWVPVRRTILELNLARIPKAPRVIREN